MSHADAIIAGISQAGNGTGAQKSEIYGFYMYVE